MNLNDFIKEDMARFLEGMAATGGENSTAGAAEISALLTGSQQVSKENEETDKKNVTIQNITNNIVEQQPQEEVKAKTSENKTAKTKPKVEKPKAEKPKQPAKRNLHNELTERLDGKNATPDEHKHIYKISHDNQQDTAGTSQRKIHHHKHHHYTSREQAKALFDLFDQIKEMKTLIKKESYVKALEKYMEASEIFEDVTKKTKERDVVAEELKKIATTLKQHIVSKSKIKEMLKKELSQKQGMKPQRQAVYTVPEHKHHKKETKTENQQQKTSSESETYHTKASAEQDTYTDVSREPEYEQALDAIKNEDKEQALKLLLKLSRRHPNNLAVKTRLEQALELQ
ncbi:MAG: hypothetical protein ACLFTH_03230 [Candidatus Woesearchaeota archaeon]